MGKTPTIAEAFRATELAAERFYRRTGTLSRNLETRDALFRLADDEARHADFAAELIGEPLMAVSPGTSSGSIGKLLAAYRQRSDSFEERVRNLGTERDVFDLAMEHEKDCVLLYNTVAAGFSGGLLKSRFEKVRDQEMAHFDKLWALRSSWAPWARLEGASDGALTSAIRDLEARVRRGRSRPSGRARTPGSKVAT